MKSTRYLLTCFLLLASPCISWARIGPSFMLDYSAWHATDIVVATEGETVDGKLSILQTWKGDLSPGDALTIDDLRAFADEEIRTVKSHWKKIDDDKKAPIIVSGNRMILFLKRGKSPSTTGRHASPTRWEPASLFGGMKVSVVWFEGENTYAFTQAIRPGPTLLARWFLSEIKMREKVEEISQTQELLANVAAIPEATERASGAAPYVRSDILFARREAFRILADCKMPAVPVLRQMLADESNADQYGAIIDAMAAAGGSELAPEFVRIVEKELKFWKEKAPSLQQGWWNDKGLEQPDEVARLRGRYVKILHVLYGLREMKYERSRNVVKAFRDYWRSLPQLGDKKGIDQISRAVDAVLNALGRNE